MTAYDYKTEAGTTIRYSIQGKDPEADPIVFLHDAGNDSRTFRRCARALDRKNSVWLVDLYGHGGSEKDPDLYRLERCGQDIAELIRRQILLLYNAPWIARFIA